MADSTLVLNTTNMSTVCSNYKSKVSSIDLASVDVTSMFEPFTSVGVLTSYVPSLKEALQSITDNCTSLISILENLVATQSTIDQGTESGAGTNYFSDYGGSSSSGGYSGSSGSSGGGGSYSSSGGGQTTSTDNGQSTISINNPTVEQPTTSLATDSGFMQSLISIASTSPTALTSEDRASYLKELLKIKNQNNSQVLEVIESIDPTTLQTYLKSILNGELPITNVAQSVTFDILESIAKERNIELTELITTENVDDIRQKVEEMSDEYMTLFSSNNLSTELLSIYDGVAEGKTDSFISSVRTAVDMIAINKDISSESLLAEEQYEPYLKEEIGKVTEALSEIRLMSTKSNSEFVEALTTLFSENAEVFTDAATTTES